MSSGAQTVCLHDSKPSQGGFDLEQVCEACTWAKQAILNTAAGPKPVKFSGVGWLCGNGVVREASILAR